VTLGGNRAGDQCAHLPPESRGPTALTATRSAGCRVDRFEVSSELARALKCYQQFDSGGPDHHAILLTPDHSMLAQAKPPGRS
jgi:hypothetical protein